MLPSANLSNLLTNICLSTQSKGGVVNRIVVKTLAFRDSGQRSLPRLALLALPTRTRTMFTEAAYRRLRETSLVALPDGFYRRRHVANHLGLHPRSGSRCPMADAIPGFFPSPILSLVSFGPTTSS